MKFRMLLILFLIFSVSAASQTGQGIFYNEVTFFLNENGENVSQAEFEILLKENATSYHRWDQVENDSIRIARLIPKKQTFNVSYPEIFKAVKEHTQLTFPGNPLIIIHYNYLDDLCSPATGFNYWDTLRIRRSKRFSDNLIRRLEQDFPNVIALHFFELGIEIEPSQILKQFFYIDKTGYFRNKIFKTPSSCGSIALIRPGGRTIIFNGETPVPEIADAMKD